jgi:hypothetical protein
VTASPVRPRPSPTDRPTERHLQHLSTPDWESAEPATPGQPPSAPSQACHADHSDRMHLHKGAVIDEVLPPTQLLAEAAEDHRIGPMARP